MAIVASLDGVTGLQLTATQCSHRNKRLPNTTSTQYYFCEKRNITSSPAVAE